MSATPTLTPMRIIGEQVRGVEFRQDGLVAVWLAHSSDGSAPTVTLAYALSTLGPEEHVLPALVLDDWGNEKRSLETYQWIRDEGQRFPRAEVFCYGLDGEKRQQFLREFDLTVNFPCYAIDSVDAPSTARRVRAFVITGDAGEVVRLRQAPDDIGYPLRAARVAWWQVPPEIAPEAILAHLQADKEQ